MAELGGGGTYGGSRWNGVSMIDMWLAVSNQETEPHWQLLTGWRKSYELTLQHMMTVKGYRENLAAAWPPEKSPASAAYIQRLDELIANLQQTYDAAVANHSAFSSATLALSSARRDLDKVVTEYVSNEGKLAAFEKEQAAVQPKGALARPPEAKPPVAAARQEQLMVQARRIMNGLSSELTQARVQITNPPPYRTNEGISDGKSVGSVPPYAGPPIPPVVPVDPRSGTAVTTSSLPTLSSPSQADIPPTVSPAVRQPGLILGSVEAPGGNLHPVGPPVPSGGGATAPSAGPAALPFAPSTGSAALSPRAVQAGPSSQRGTAKDVLRSGSSSYVGNATRAPQGGVIGASPGAGVVQPTPGGRGAHTISPFGGVIGASTPTSASPSRNASSPGYPISNLPGRGMSENEKSDSQKQRIRDDFWGTTKGVHPVVLPVTERRIDSGPAIGLE